MVLQVMKRQLLKGIIAGINSVRKIDGKEPLILDR